MSDEQNMPVGLWTDGQQCLVLASVRLAFWASKIADHDNDDVAGEYTVFVKCDMAKSKYFVVVDNTNGNNMYWTSGKRHRDHGVSFLRALSLYWETRS